MTVIGIDLGISYSCVGVYRHNRVDIIKNDMGNRIKTSYVAFTDEGILIGDSAKNQASVNPTNTVFDIKRLMSFNFSNYSIQKDMQQWPFKVIGDDNDKPQIEVQFKGTTRHFYPEEIIAMLFAKLKEDAEKYLSEKVIGAVITVPAYFNNYQIQMIEDSAFIAGLNVMRIICDSTAAGIAFGFNEKSDNECHVLIFDLGGGTQSVSLLNIEGGMFEVKATAGDTHLGGEDFDIRMVSYFMDRFMKKYRFDLRQSPRALRQLRTECEDAKKRLSTATTASIICPSLYEGHDFNDSISRAMFEKLNNELFRSTMNPVAQVLKDAKMSKSDVTDIVLVGGSSRIPRVQQLLQDFFNGKQPCCGVDPDEAVAIGAAVQAAIIKNDTSKAVKDILILDVVPLSLGIETKNGEMAVIIPRCSILPVKKSQVFSTTTDNQTVYTVKVYEGERSKTKDNFFLTLFDLKGIKPAPKGVQQIEVTIDIDSNRVITVSAKDKSTGNTNSI